MGSKSRKRKVRTFHFLFSTSDIFRFLHLISLFPASHFYLPTFHVLHLISLFLLPTSIYILYFFISYIHLMFHFLLPTSIFLLFTSYISFLSSCFPLQSTYFSRSIYISFSTFYFPLLTSCFSLPTSHFPLAASHFLRLISLFLLKG